MKNVLSELLNNEKDQAWLVSNMSDGRVIGVFGGSTIETDQTPIERVEGMVCEEFGLEKFDITSVEVPDGIVFEIDDEDTDTQQTIGLTHAWIY